MKDHDYKAGGAYVKDFAAKVIDKFGPRLPGSVEENAAADFMAEEFSAVTETETKVEEFKLAPTASIGAIPILGFISFLVLALYFISPWASLITGILLLFYAVVQVFMYTGWFDRFFPQKTSKNIYSVLDGGEKIDYTIIYSGHMDSSWNWNLSDTKRPQLSIIKTIYGVVGILAFILLSIIRIAMYHFSFPFNGGLQDAADWVFFFFPFVFLPGCYWLSSYLSYDKKIASPGAMDNLTGMGLSLLMAKHYKENPDELPKNCRIIIAGMGSEEAGLKGSFAFMKAHKDDKELFINPYFVNLDSFRDYEHFNVVTGDLWLMSHFSPELIEMGEASLKEAGLTPKKIKNPVGGCDSTPIYRAGYKTVTLNAQNPTATSYYHTQNDKVEDLDLNTLEKAYEVVVNISNKIHNKHKADS
ncbi:MAG: Zn-dependent exopeptidase M28 [Christensenellaceae bacterium]|jgi:hypothetical protein|nr:Zn-dependent exopeptidase M28 [Christensenellaceae bacterium]